MHIGAGLVAGLAAGAVPDRAMVRAVRRSPAGRRHRAEQDHRRCPVRGRQVRDAGVAADHQPGMGDQGGEVGQSGGGHGRRVESGLVRHAYAKVLLRGGTGDQHAVARRAQVSCDGREAVGGPATPRGLRAGMDDRDAAWHGHGGDAERQIGRVGGDAVVAQQPAPAVHLVLLLDPRGAAGVIGVGDSPQLARHGGA